MDNALIQLHGEKRVLLFPPRLRRSIPGGLVVARRRLGGGRARRNRRRNEPPTTEAIAARNEKPPSRRTAPRAEVVARGSFAAGRRVVHPRALGAPHGGRSPVRRGERVLARAPEDRVPAEGPVRQRRPARRRRRCAWSIGGQALAIRAATSTGVLRGARPRRVCCATCASARRRVDVRGVRRAFGGRRGVGGDIGRETGPRTRSLTRGGRRRRKTELRRNASCLGALFAPPAAAADVARAAARRSGSARSSRGGGYAAPPGVRDFQRDTIVYVARPLKPTTRVVSNSLGLRRCAFARRRGCCAQQPGERSPGCRS